MKLDLLPIFQNERGMKNYLVTNFRRIQDLFTETDAFKPPVGPWVDWVPEMYSTGGTVGYGTGTLRLGRYKLLDTKTVIFNLFFRLGNDMILPAGTYSFSLPLVPARPSPPYYSVLSMFIDSSVGIVYAGAAGPDFAGVGASRISPHFHGHGAWTTAVPVAWGLNDEIHMNGIYEIA